MKMVWLSNILSPTHPFFAVYGVLRRDDQTQEEAVSEFIEWLTSPPPNEKFRGPPKATEHYTVAELVAMGMEGVYRLEHP